MQICGIVAEYNPFHNGHKYQIDETKRLGNITHVVAVMSSNYVQRGETALLSKWARAETAVNNGVDLVIDLPTPWSSSYAQRFAGGAVYLLDALGCVDILSFGSECGNIDKLIECRDAIKSDAVEEKLKEYIGCGLCYAAARSKAIEEVYGDKFANITDNPNNNLGIEYLNTLLDLNSTIAPMTIGRTGSAHDSSQKSGVYASASELRRLILNNDESWINYVPQSTVDIFRREKENGRAPCKIKKLELSILCRLRQLSIQDIAKSPDISEGIEFRIHDAVMKAGSLEELYALAKTKRYTHARIRRIVLHSFLELCADDCKKNPPYIHVLAMNDKGKEILKEAKKTTKIPIVTKASDFDELDEYGKHIFEIENTCTDIYSLTSPKVLACGREKTNGIVIINGDYE